MSHDNITDNANVERSGNDNARIYSLLGRLPIQYEADETAFNLKPSAIFERFRHMGDREGISGWQIFLIFLEELGNVPSQETAKAATVLSETISDEYDKQITSKRYDKAAGAKRLAAVGVIGPVSEKTVADAQDQAERILEQRATAIERLKFLQQGYDAEYLKTDSSGQARLDIDKIEELYMKTDGYVAQDQMLSFTSSLKEEAHNERERHISTTADRFTRYVFLAAQSELDDKA